MRSLFDEMDARADELGWDPPTHHDALEVEFRILQKLQQPGLKTDQWKDLFALWCERYDGRQHVKEAERQARLEALIERQRKMLIERDGMSSADQRAFATAQIYEVGMEITNLITPREYKGPLATWGDAA